MTLDISIDWLSFDITTRTINRRTYHLGKYAADFILKNVKRKMGSDNSVRHKAPLRTVFRTNRYFARWLTCIAYQSRYWCSVVRLHLLNQSLSIHTFGDVVTSLCFSVMCCSLLSSLNFFILIGILHLNTSVNCMHFFFFGAMFKLEFLIFCTVTVLPLNLPFWICWVGFCSVSSSSCRNCFPVCYFLWFLCLKGKCWEKKHSRT